MGKIDKRSNLLLQDFMQEYVIPNRPVILTDASKTWQAHGLFTPQFFKTNFADKTAPLKGKVYKLADYIDLMLTTTPENPAPYPFKLNLEKNFKELIGLVQPDFEIMKKNRLKSPFFLKSFIPQAATLEIFFGGPSGWFPYIHYDLYGMYAIVTQVYGHKEFILYEPGEEKYLYPDPENPWMSTIKNYHEPDYDKYPLFKNAKSVSDVVGPGETVFVPKGWWHTARSLEPTISIAKDLLVHQNWDVFRRDVVFYKRKQSMLKAAAMNLYLNVLDGIMNVHEKMITEY